MAYILTTMAFFVVVAMLVPILVNTPPAKIVYVLTRLAPLSVFGLGGILTIFGRASLGFPLIMFGLYLWRQVRQKHAPVSGSPNQSSTVRSQWLEMQLDHETGNLDGVILIGEHANMPLSDLNQDTLMDVYQEMYGDQESASLMEAYFDRRFAGWRDNTQGSSGSGQDSASGSGTMTEKEAYEVLGLTPGAGLKEIKSAHRRLMKAVHPDNGGSTFLAARINQAKETLIN